MLLTRTFLPLYFDIIIIHEWLQTQRIVQRSHNPTILFPQLTKVALRSLMQISFFFSVAELEPLWVKFQLNMSHMLFSVQLLQKFIPSLNFCWVPNVSLDISSCQMSVFSFDLKNKKKMFSLDNYWQILTSCHRKAMESKNYLLRLLEILKVLDKGTCKSCMLRLFSSLARREFLSFLNRDVRSTTNLLWLHLCNSPYLQTATHEGTIPQNWHVQCNCGLCSVKWL